MGITFHPDGRIIHSSGVEIASEKMVDHWRLSADVTPTVNTSYYVATNWERVDTDGGAGNYFGTGMTESSGEFTFPKTGIYHISITGVFYGNAHTGNSYIATTIDGSSYSDAAVSLQRVSDNSTSSSASCEHIFDVTNTSTHKVKYKVYVSGSSLNVMGSSSRTESGITFTRLGDT